MQNPFEPMLKPVAILDLRPTQVTVGMREVEEKRNRLNALGSKGSDFLGRHMIPIVLGPKRRQYILDHHHLALALHREGINHVLTSEVADLSRLSKDAFWYVLAHKNWLHLYDDAGELKDVQDLPKSVEGLVDDPYRSLAGELRRAGGFAKDTTLYSEFLWADFLRRALPRKNVDRDFEGAVKTALKLAKSKDADYLPGWSGPEG